MVLPLHNFVMNDELYAYLDVCLSRLSEKEDKCDSLGATMQSYKDQLTSLQAEKSRVEKELKSNISNLASALKRSKDTYMEQAGHLLELKRKKQELVVELEDLQQERDISLTNMRRLSFSIPNSPMRHGGNQVISAATPSTCSTPSRAIPEESQIISLHVENKRLKQELSCLQTNFQLSSQKSTQVRSDLKDAVASLSDLQAQYDNVVQEKLDVLSKLEIIKSEFQDHKPKAIQEREICELKEKVQELRAELEQAHKENLELRSKSKSERSKENDGKAYISKLECRVKSLREDKVATEKELATVQNDASELQEQLRESSTCQDSYKSKTSRAIEGLEMKVSRLTKERTDISNDLDQAHKQLDRVQDDVESLQEDKKRLESKLQSREREICTLRVQTNPNCTSQEVETLQTENRSLKWELEDIHSKTKELENSKVSLEHKVSDLKAENKKLKGSIGRETKKTEDVARKIIAELEMSETKVQTLKVDISAKAKECSNLKGKLELAESRLTSTTNSKQHLNQHISDLKEKALELETKNAKLEAQLQDSLRETLKKENDSQASTQKISELESKLDAVEFAVLERESTIIDLRCSDERMELENKSLLAQVTSLSEMVSARNLKLESQHAQINQHELEVYEIMEKISQLEVDHGSCSKTITQLTTQNDALKLSLDKEVARKEALKDQVGLLKEEITKLKVSLSDVKLTNTELSYRFQELTTKHDDLCRRHSTMEEQSYRLETDLKSEKSTTSASKLKLGFEQFKYKEEKIKFESQIESLLLKLQNSEKECSTLEQEKSYLSMQLAEFKTEVDTLKFSYTSLTREKDGLEEQYEKLKDSALSILLSESFTVPNEENKSPSVQDKSAEYIKSLASPTEAASMQVTSKESEKPRVEFAPDEVENQTAEHPTTVMGKPKDKQLKSGTRRALQMITFN